MKERIKEIIAYIMDVDYGGEYDLAFLHHELEDLGYSNDEITQAFNILEFSSGQDDLGRQELFRKTNRILGEGEKILLSTEAQGYLIGLHSTGWLTEAQLSTIIENAGMEYSLPVSLADIIEMTARSVPEIPDDVLVGAPGASDSLN
jgi:uncharacterized protein Smg (DUF494 family)